MPVLTTPDPGALLARSPRRLAVLPRDMPWGHAPGPVPYRVLLAGGDAVAGHGVRSHDLGVAGCLARSISSRTAHGADVQLVLSERSAPSELDALLRAQRVEGLDAVVLVVSPRRFGWTSSRFGAELHRLVTGLSARLPEGAPVVVATATGAEGAASVGDAVSPGRFSEIVAAAVPPVAVVVELPGRAGPVETGTELYREWGDVISGALVPRMQEPQLGRVLEDDIDEGARQRAVGRMGALDRSWESQFERFVALARAGYGARSASLSVVDGPHTRFLARQGVDSAILRREDTICASVLAKPGGVIVGDARKHPHFRHLPPVEGGNAVFYAGYRVPSPDGQPVAVLCVFDPEPRSALDQDLTLLSDLAHAAQRRMWDCRRRAIG